MIRDVRMHPPSQPSFSYFAHPRMDVDATLGLTAFSLQPKRARCGR